MKANKVLSYKNPSFNDGETPLFPAAKNGHFNIYKLIIQNVEEKNPSRIEDGATPLYMAAWQGHFEIYKLIIENVKERILHVMMENRHSLQLLKKDTLKSAS